MKKIIIPAISLLLIIMILLIFTLIPSTKQITSSTEIEVIKQDSNLDILVNLNNFSKESYSEEKLLDVAMQYASKLNLINEQSTDDTYIQYVEKETLHNLIFELTGVKIDAPIEIEDFYYLYDSENKYYYYIGLPTSYYYVSNINSIERKNNTYFINCSIEKGNESEIEVFSNVSIVLNRITDNSLISYQVQSIDIK